METRQKEYDKSQGGMGTGIRMGQFGEHCARRMSRIGQDEDSRGGMMASHGVFLWWPCADTRVSSMWYYVL